MKQEQKPTNPEELFDLEQLGQYLHKGDPDRKNSARKWAKRNWRDVITVGGKIGVSYLKQGKDVLFHKQELIDLLWRKHGKAREVV